MNLANQTACDRLAKGVDEYPCTLLLFFSFTPLAMNHRVTVFIKLSCHYFYPIGISSVSRSRLLGAEVFKGCMQRKVKSIYVRYKV